MIKINAFERRIVMKNKELLHERHDFENVRELIEWAGNEYSEKPLFSWRDSLKAEKSVSTFESFRGDVRALATKLRDMGCTGKHCVLIGKMSYEWALVYYSVMCAGGVLVPLDRDWGAPELAKTSGKADVAFLFCDADIAEKASVIAEETGLATPVVYLKGIKSEDTDSLASLVAEGKALYEGDPKLYSAPAIDNSVTSLIVFTSGTTGEGKGVMLPQKAFLTDLSSVIPYIDFSGKSVSVLPPHHTYGSSVMLIGHVMIGAEVYISAGLKYIQKELGLEKPGHLILVPLYLETFYRKIMAKVKDGGKEKTLRRMIKVSNALRKVGIDLRNVLFKSVRAAFGGNVSMVISGGAPINSEIINFFEAVGISTLNGYGITECAPIIAVNRSKRNKFGTVGPVLDICDVKIDSPNEAGEGEIWVKGPNVMLGYYKNDEATAAAFSEDGYFKTGDYGRLDGDVITITGRKKNLIILSNGKNVYPEEIESDLIATPGVIDIIVYEGQSKRGMEHNAIVAEVYPDKDYMEKNGITDVKAYLQKYVEQYNKTAIAYKKIGVLKVRDEEFPKNTLRKILRFKLDMTID